MFPLAAEERGPKTQAPARIGYAIAIGIWSVAAMGHALAASVVGFAIARFFLGLGEAGNFPAAISR